MSDFKNTLSEVKKNQWNYWNNNFYNKFEINTIVSELQRILLNEEYSQGLSKWAFVSLLSVNMALTDKDVMECVVAEDNKDKSINNKDTNFIFLNNEKFRLIFSSPEDGYSPREKELIYLEKFQEYIDLPFHPTLMQHLKKFINTEINFPITISKLISLSYEDYLRFKAKGNRIINNLNVRGLGRKKLANVIPATIVKKTKDIIFAEKLRDKGKYFNSLSVYYYASYNENKLYEKYLECVKEVFGDVHNERQQLELNLITGDVYVGSKVTIKEEKLRRFVLDITNDTKISLKRLNSFENLIEAHNSYAIYVLTQILDITAIRPSTDVLVRKSAFLINESGIIVSDKKTLTGNEGRLLPIPSQCMDQFKEYIEHLQALSGRIAEYDKKLAKKIWLLTQETEDLMPLFFLINMKGKWKSIGENELESYHRKYWPLYCRCFRQNLISELIKHEVNSEYILYQLGHERSGEDPYSLFSVLSHKILQDIVNPVLEKIWTSHGWKVLPGISKYLKRNAEFDKEIITREKVYLGAEKRRMERELASNSCLKEKIKQEKYSERNQKLIGFGNYIRNCLYTEILNYYKNDNKNTTQELACIWLLGVVYDGVLDERYYTHFSVSIINFIQKRQGVLYIRLLQSDNNENTPVKVWIPSPMTANLIINFLENASVLKNNIGEIEFSLIKKEAIQIIKNLKCDRYSEFFVGGDRAIIKNLIKSCYLTQTLSIPSVLSDISINNLDETSLCHNGVQRLLHGKKAIIKDQELNNLKSKPNLCIDNSNIQEKFYRYLNDDKKICRKYNKNSNRDNVGGKTTRRRAASLEILQNMGKRKTVPLISSYLTLWGNSLLSSKSLYGYFLEPETVATYMDKVGRAIQDFGFGQIHAEYDEGYFKNIFKEIVKHDETNIVLFERYIDFYEFISDEYSYDKIDFHEIAPSENIRQARVKANIVFFNEYQASLKNIDNRNDLSDREKIHCKTVLILTFRSGGRISEIYGLKIRDLILDEINHIRIENNSIRPVKTTNANRKDMLLLTEEERSVLEYWISIRKNDEIGSDEDALFSDGRVFRKNSQYWKVTTLIRDTLREVTGDPEVNIHSLRHSYANYHFIWMTRGNKKHNSWQVNDWLKGTHGEKKTFEKVMLNCEYPTRRSLFFLAHQMGHGSPETTIKNYIHCSPWLLHDFSVNNLPNLTDSQISILTNISETNVPKYRARKGDSKGEYKNITSWKINKSKNICEKVNVHPVKANKKNNLIQRSNDLPLTTLSCILSDIASCKRNDILLKHGLNEGGLNKLIAVAKCIEEETGYTHFNIIHYTENSGNDDFGSNIPRNNINKRVIKNIELLIKNKNRELLDTLKIWAKYYRVRHSGLFVSNTNEGRITSGLLRMIGFRSHLCLIITSSVKKLGVIRENILIEKWKKETDINRTIEKTIEDTGVSVKNSTGFDSPVPGITILNKSKKGVERSNFHYLHHYFFLSLVYLKWQEFTDDY